MNIVIAGGTGFIGKALVAQLVAQKHRVILLTRQVQTQQSPHVTSVTWDGKTQDQWASFIDGTDAVINLCGESVAAKRWTPEQKEKIISSRIGPSAALSEAIFSARKKPPVFIQASGTGFYGNRADELITETAGAGRGFLAETCVKWEGSAQAISGLTRVVFLRFGAVLEKEGGAVQKMLPPFYFFMGGPIGSGKQWLPWIHRADAAGVIIHALTAQELQGPVNAVAAESVTMEKFCKTLGAAIHRPSWLPVPAPVLKTLMGEGSELLLNSQRVVPARLMRSGYQFLYPNLREALDAIVKKKAEKPRIDSF